MRQAVAYAIPYAQIISKVYAGFATPLNSIEVPAYEGYTGKYWTYETNIAKAKALVAEAGVSGAQMNLSYTAANPQHAQVAIAIQTALAELGITVNLDAMPAAASPPGRAGRPPGLPARHVRVGGAHDDLRPAPVQDQHLE